MGQESVAEPFPTERFLALVRRTPSYARLAWRLARDPDLPRGRRAALIAAGAYLASPIDLVPGIIPVVGQLDDAVVGLTALRFGLRGLSPRAQAHHLAATGLRSGNLDEDLRTTRLVAGWLARRSARLSWRAVRLGLGGAIRVGRHSMRWLARMAPR